MRSHDDLLIRGLVRQLERSQPNGIGSAAPRRRITVDDINVGGRRTFITHDTRDDALIVAGIATELAEVPTHIRDPLVAAISRFDQAQDEQLVAAAKQTIESLVADLLRRRRDLDRAIRARSYANSTTRAD
jgi:hypothetical protein